MSEWRARTCPDCPGAQLDVLRDVIEREDGPCWLATRAVEAGALLPLSWAQSYAFGLVRRGVLVRQHMGPDGVAVAVDLVGRGGFFSLREAALGLPRRSASKAAAPVAARAAIGRAVTDLSVCLCPLEAEDRALSESTRVGRDLLRLARAAQERVEQLAYARGCATATQRVAVLFGVLEDTLRPASEPGRAFPAGLTQRTLAELAGIRHETFCRSLKELRGAGLLEQSEGGIRILDRVGLDAIGMG